MPRRVAAQAARDRGFTAYYDVTRLLYFEIYDGVGMALRREKQRKGWRREKKIASIEKWNLHWEDLRRAWYPAGCGH